MARMRGADMKEIAVNIISGVVRKELSAISTIDDQIYHNVVLSEDSNDVIMKSEDGAEKDPDEMDDIGLKEYLGEESLFLIMEEVLKTLQEEETKDEFIEQLYEYNIDNELNYLELNDTDADASIVCPFCRLGNMIILENEGYGHCIGCGIHISLYSSLHNRKITLVELRSSLAEFFDYHGNGNCCCFDNIIGTSHLQITCLNQNIQIECLACRFSGNLF
jgi:hypothetical protein